MARPKSRESRVEESRTEDPPPACAQGGEEPAEPAEHVGDWRMTVRLPRSARLRVRAFLARETSPWRASLRAADVLRVAVLRGLDELERDEEQGR